MAPWHLTIQFLLAVIMYAISYKSIVQPQIFFLSQPGENNTNEQPKEKYRTSSLDADNAKRIEEKLILLMEEKKPYLDPELSLETLARQLNESRYHISQVVNGRLKLKFNDFVNHYRVKEFKQQMMRPRRRKPTVEMLAKLSAFNSKTSFHTVFKKITGMTPSKFYKETMAEKAVK
jgi:YesN/AraC family two-component response regulator